MLLSTYGIAGQLGEKTSQQLPENECPLPYISGKRKRPEPLADSSDSYSRSFLPSRDNDANDRLRFVCFPPFLSWIKSSGHKDQDVEALVICPILVVLVQHPFSHLSAQRVSTSTPSPQQDNDKSKMMEEEVRCPMI